MGDGSDYGDYLEKIERIATLTATCEELEKRIAEADLKKTKDWIIEFGHHPMEISKLTEERDQLRVALLASVTSLEGLLWKLVGLVVGVLVIEAGLFIWWVLA